jgi:hypothetical protein
LPCFVLLTTIIYARIHISNIAFPQLFGRFNGLSDVRLPPGRPGLAFVEYQTEELSAAAQSALNGFEFDVGTRLKVSFAAK